MSKKVPISFEFFPTKTDAGAEKLKVVHQELQLLNPEFFSITYGAGGSTRERTLAAIAEFNGKGTPVAPHLSCIGDDKARIAELLDIYKDQGIDRIVALRGDLPSGQVGLGSCHTQQTSCALFVSIQAITSILKLPLTLKCIHKQKALI